MLHDAKLKFDFHQTSSSTSSNISLVLRCKQQCCIRLATVSFPYPTLLNARMPTKLTWRVSIATIYGLYLLRALPRESSIYSMANDQSFKSLSDESLNTSDLSSNRKKKGGGGGKGVCETITQRKARRWYEAGVARSRAIF